MCKSFSQLRIKNYERQSPRRSQLRGFLPQRNTKGFHKGTQRNNLGNLENTFTTFSTCLMKILVQTEKICGHLFNLSYLCAKNSGLPRPSCLTARNDDRSLFAGDSCFRRNDGMGKKNLANLENLTKIVVQDKERKEKKSIAS